MTQYLNTVIDRPVTDFRHFSSVLKADAAVKHHWTAIQRKAFRNPANNRWRIPARKGSVALDAYDDSVTWAARGAYQVPTFTSATGNTGRFSASIPNPGNLISVLMLSYGTANASEAWGLHWASDASFIWYSPHRDATNRTLNNGAHINFPPTSPLNQWNFEAVVIDMANNVCAASTNNGAFVTATPTVVLTPHADANITVMFGQGITSQPYHNGLISDLAIIAGDVRTMPTLMAAFQEYNQTGYTA